MDSSVWRSRRRAAALVFVFIAVFMARTGRRSASRRARPDSEPTVATRYVPDTTEGLGASVAILIDNSGSMKDRAGMPVRAFL